MKPQRLALPSSIALALLAGGQTVAFGQTVARPARQTQEPTEVQRSAPARKLAKATARLDAVVLAAIRSHPLTAPYPISTTCKREKSFCRE